VTTAPGFTTRPAEVAPDRRVRSFFDEAVKQRSPRMVTRLSLQSGTRKTFWPLTVSVCLLFAQTYSLGVTWLCGCLVLDTLR